MFHGLCVVLWNPIWYSLTIEVMEMESRINRQAALEGCKRLLSLCDFRLLNILYQLLRYIMAED